MQPNQTVTSPKITAVYNAVIKQSGTNVETAEEKLNTFQTITWSRVTVGEYKGQFDETVDPNDFTIHATLSANNSAPKIVRANVETNQIYIITEDNTGTQTDINSGTEPGLYLTLIKYK